MMRFSRTQLVKLMIVESPNKVAKLTSLCHEHFVRPGFGFGDKKLEKICKPGESIRVMPTVGHFMEMQDIRYVPAKKADDAAAAATLARSPAGESEGPTYKPVWTVKQPKPFGGGGGMYGGKGGAPAPSKFANQRNPIEEIQAFLKATKDITEVIIATDPDREGELIGCHVRDYLTEKGELKKIPYSRAYIHAITADGVKHALSGRTLNFIDENLVAAAEARHVMDRTFGFLGSTMARHVNGSLRSVGRVQTPSVILLHEREELIKKYHSEHVATYQLRSEVRLGQRDGGDDPTATISFTSIPLRRGAADAAAVGAADGEGDDDGVLFPSLADAEAALQSLNLAGVSSAKALNDAKVKKTSTKAPQPLTMQTMISQCNRSFGMSSEATAAALQDLFSKGFVTYPRTDSTRIDPAFAAKLRETIAKTYGPEYVAAPPPAATASATAAAASSTDDGDKKPKKGGKKKKEAAASDAGNVEDAHEAIRPTSVLSQEAEVPADKRRVYRLIYGVTVASLMVPKVTESIGVDFVANEGTAAQVNFRLGAARVAEPGFTKALDKPPTPTAPAAGTPAAPTSGAATDDGGDATGGALDDSAMAPKSFDALAGLKKNTIVPLSLCNFVATEKKGKPPGFLTEGGLIAELKRNGVGRPSTYPSIVRTLEQRGYIQPTQKRLSVTPAGALLCEAAKSMFPNIVDIGFTARFESKLDAIAKGGASMHEVLDDFDRDFIRIVTDAARRSKIARGMSTDDAAKHVPAFADCRTSTFGHVQSQLERYLTYNFVRGPAK